MTPAWVGGVCGLEIKNRMGRIYRIKRDEGVFTGKGERLKA